MKMEHHLWAHRFTRHSHVKHRLHFVQVTWYLEPWWWWSCNLSQRGMLVLDDVTIFLKGADPLKLVNEIFIIFFPQKTLRRKGTIHKSTLQNKSTFESMKTVVKVSVLNTINSHASGHTTHPFGGKFLLRWFDQLHKQLPLLFQV